MLKVSTAVKNAYSGDRADKHLLIEFPEIGLTLTHTQIRGETSQLKEALLDRESIEFVGCIVSQFKLTIDAIPQKLKGKRIKASTYTDDTASEPVRLFSGIVESDERTSGRRSKQLIAYDDLYGLETKDVTSWFYTQVKLLAEGKKITIKQFRTRLFKELGIPQVKRTLVNDSFSIKKLVDMVLNDDEDEEEQEKIYALDLIKAICQINGVFGIMNRYGKFDYRSIGIDEEDAGAYPGADPDNPSDCLSLPFIPGSEVITTLTDATYYPTHRGVDYEDYEVHGITRVYVRQDEQSKAGYAGSSPKYRYYVQGNRFTLGTTKKDRQDIALGILTKVQGVTYTPFKAVCTGLPYLEVGDPVSFYEYDFEESEKQGKDVYTLKSFYVLSRTLKGIQSMTDTLSAPGEERQRRFYSDLGVREEVSNAVLKEKVEQNTNNISSNTDRIEKMENKGWDVVTTATEPTPEERVPKTIYFIKGSVG